jgi:hypothetical protein
MQNGMVRSLQGPWQDPSSALLIPNFEFPWLDWGKIIPASRRYPF